MSFKSTNGHNTGMILLYTGHISYIPSRNITLSWPFIQSLLERKVFVISREVQFQSAIIDIHVNVI